MGKINKILVLLILTLFIVSVKAQDPLAVVVNKANPVKQLSKSELIDLFMGKYVAFPNNVKAIPVELIGTHEVKAEFYNNLVGMPLSRINAYWSRLRFTGRKRVAVFKPNEKNIIAFIILNEQAIGYLPMSLITEDLKVVYILNE